VLRRAAHRTDIDTSYMGDSVAKWDGGTLVVDVNNLNDDTWLGPDGSFHSEAMHVVERLTKNGDTLNYQVTVEDPNVFTRPWVMNPRTLRLCTGEPRAQLPPVKRIPFGLASSAPGTPPKARSFVGLFSDVFDLAIIRAVALTATAETRGPERRGRQRCRPLTVHSWLSLTGATRAATLRAHSQRSPARALEGGSPQQKGFSRWTSTR
jgi:hypothetical protein